MARRREAAIAVIVLTLMLTGCGDSFTSFPSSEGGQGGATTAGNASGGSGAHGGSAGPSGGAEDGGAGGGGDERPTGSTCEHDSDCASSFCAGGICCSSRCDGECLSCRGEDTCGVDGTCAPVALGTDPRNQCAGEQRCFASGCAEGTLAFVSSSTHATALGGVEGADAICQGLADDACLGGTYFAWVSSSSSSPAQRFTRSEHPYRLVDGTAVASGWSDLTDGSLAAPIDLTEKGTSPPGSAMLCGTSTLVHTGTTSDGAGYATNCSSWTSNEGDGSWGNWAATSSTWSLHCTSVNDDSCGVHAPIFCFQQ